MSKKSRKQRHKHVVFGAYILTIKTCKFLSNLMRGRYCKRGVCPL